MTAPGASASRPIELDDAQRIAWLRLIRSENVGPVSFRALVNRFGSAQAALEALPELALRGGSRGRIRVTDAASVENEIACARRMGARFACLGEANYPRLLLHIDAPPPVLAIMGDAKVFRRPSLAIVGARNASLAGVKFTRQIARDVGEAGFVVVSGLARGIDAAAHEAAVPTGTVGVFAGGLDKPYPKENTPLMRRIVDGDGCLVSEMPFGWEPRAVDFPRRNRIVAALSQGLLVVEAALRSGSLISARLAGEYGRLVFAVPGSPLDPRAAGANKLLKEGAILVTHAEDVIDALRPLDDRMPSQFRETDENEPRLDDDEPTQTDRGSVMNALGPTPVSLDDLLDHTGADPSAIQLILLELDLAGRLERHPGGYVSLTP